MRGAAASPVALLAVLALAGCFQELDSNAANATREQTPRDPNAPPTTAIDDPGIALNPDDENAKTDDPCVKTSKDAHDILRAYCAKCHDQGDASSGVPKFDFLLNDQALISANWTVGGEVRKFVVPGDPDNSWLYRRPLLGTMPPIPTDLRNADSPRPTISDLSVLRTWIASCLGPKSAPSPRMDATDTAKFSFETDAQGWATLSAGAGQGVFSKVEISSAQAFAGASSLAATIDGTTALAYAMEVQSLPIVIPPGCRITLHVLLPADAPIGFLEPYVIDASGTMTASPWVYPSTGAWSTLTVVVPTTAPSIAKLGIQLHTGGAWSGTVYVDSIEW
jgi:hypothetical protein